MKPFPNPHKPSQDLLLIFYIFAGCFPILVLVDAGGLIQAAARRFPWAFPEELLLSLTISILFLIRRFILKKRHLESLLRERREAEEKAVEREKAFEELLSRLQEAVYRISLPDGRCEYLSRAAETVFGYPREDFLNEPFFFRRILHPEDKDIFNHELNRLIRGKVSPVFEYRIIDRAGKRRWIHQSNTGVYDKKGRLIALEGYCAEITDRKEAEIGLRASEEQLREASEMARTYGWEWDIRANRLRRFVGTFQILGITSDETETTYERLLAWVLTDDREVVARHIGAALESRRLDDFEFRILRPDKTIRWIFVRGRVVVDAGGVPLRMVGTLQDITERKRIEEAFRQERDRAQQYLDVAGVILLVIGTDFTIRMINKKGCDLLGRSQEEMIDADWIERCTPPSGAESVRRSFEAWMTGDRDVIEAVQQPILTAGGETRVISWHFTVLRNSARRVSGLLGSGEDITARLAAEAALQESERRYRNLIEASPIPIAVHFQERFVYLNKAAVRALRGESSEEFVGMAVRRIVHPNDLTDYERMRGRASHPECESSTFALECESSTSRPECESSTFALECESSTFAEVGNLTARQELRLVRLDGESIDVALIETPMRYMGRESRQFIFTDITDRKAAERDRERLERQLIRSQKMEAIGTLAGGIAHDFNNILGVVIGQAELMELFNLPRDSPAFERLQELLSAAYRARDLVEQILTFSRPSDQALYPLRLSTIAKETTRFIRSIAPSDIEVRLSIDAEDGMVCSTPARMHQVLMNLCTNAVHAMQEKGGVLEIGISEVEVSACRGEKFFAPAFAPNPDIPAMLAPGTYLRLSVRDTGVGIPPEFHDRIFDPYFTTKSVDKGTGLGLSVVHGIVTRQGGGISVASRPGEGATIRVFLPRTDETPEAEALSDEIDHLGGYETILFVDDESTVAKTGREILEQLGYSVVSRVRSTEALNAFRADPFRYDLLVTDMAMPEMSGIELARAVHAVRPDIPVILCTGFYENRTGFYDPEILARDGIRELAHKPLGVRRLAELVRRVLDAEA